jgi:5-methyltetrahydrofolate--homocysteine methyltransferase
MPIQAAEVCGMNRFSEWFKTGVVITDGAWGTELQKLGLRAGVVPDTWNVAQPERVESVARAYAEAGSEVILTNTFRANAIAMASVSSADLDAINRAGVAISKRAASKARVFASIGPTGEVLAASNFAAEQVLHAYAAQAQSLKDGGADAIVIETMSDIEEASLALEAAKPTGIPVIVSFAFDSGKNKDRTMTGTTPEMVGKAMWEAGADGIGANCGVGVEQAVAICRRLSSACDLPVWIKPNAGLPTVEGLNVRYTTSAAFFASHFHALQEAGASFVGACCGSTPEFIRALVAERGAAA